MHPRMRRARLGAVLWLAAAMLVPGACAPVAPASPAAEDASEASCAEVAGGFAVQAREALARFEEADAAAAAAGEDEARVAIDRLSAVRAEFAALEPPECALPVKVGIVRYMDLTTDIHDAVWADDCRLCIEDMRAQARAARSRALDDLESLETQP